MELILIRHGESTANASHLTAGHLDVSLSDSGRQQVRNLAGYLPGMLDSRKVIKLLSSPLSRARETAALLDLDVPVEIDERWIEMDYGDFDGMPIDSIPRSFWENWTSDVKFTPPNGESVASVGLRVREACSELASSRYSDDEVVIAVSHVSPIKAAISWALGVDDSATWHMYLDTASLSSITIIKGQPIMNRFNLSFSVATRPVGGVLSAQ